MSSVVGSLRSPRERFKCTANIKGVGMRFEILLQCLLVLWQCCSSNVLEESGEVSSEQLLYPVLKVLKYVYV